MESFGPKESSAAASSFRKLLLTPGVKEWRFGSCRRFLPWPASQTAPFTRWVELPPQAPPARLKLPKTRLRYGLPLRRPFIRLRRATEPVSRIRGGGA